jgi:hypothetical protein
MSDTDTTATPDAPVVKVETTLEKVEDFIIRIKNDFESQVRAFFDNHATKTVVEPQSDAPVASVPPLTGTPVVNDEPAPYQMGVAPADAAIADPVVADTSVTASTAAASGDVAPAPVAAPEAVPSEAQTIAPSDVGDAAAVLEAPAATFDATPDMPLAAPDATPASTEAEPVDAPKAS